MKKLQYIFAGLFIISATSFSFAQSAKIKQGEKSFKAYNYIKAIEIYEKINPKTTNINRQLAESYYMVGNPEKAEQYYQKVVVASDVKPQDYYRFGFILRMNKSYAESENWIAKYGETEKNDSRVKELMDNKGIVEKISKDENRYEIKDIDINSVQQDFGVAYYGSKVVFSSSREGIKSIVRRWNGNGLPFLNLYESKANDNGQLGTLDLLKGKVNKKFNEGPASFSQDGKQMVFTRNNYKEKAKDGTSNLELFSAELINGEWKNEKPFSFNNKEYSVGQPCLSPDGNTLYFASNMPGGLGGTDLYKTEKQNGVWSKPENLGNTINTEGNEMFPFYHPSGLFFFASDGHVGLGGLDIFIAQIKTDGFGKIKNLGVPMNTNNDDFSFVLNKESESGYFASNRSGGKGSDDIYYFRLLKPFSFGKTINGIVKDKNGNPVSDATIKLMDDTGKEIAKIISEENGSYSFPVEADKKFTLIGKKEKYFDGETKTNTIGDADVFVANLELEKDPGLSLYFLITEKGTKTPIEGVKIKLTNNLIGKDELITTSANGDFRKTLGQNKLNDRVSYNISMEKEGYLSKTVTYNKQLDKEGIYNVHKDLDLSMDKIAVGQDLAKIIDIKPIYFDLGKSTIRKDAGAELEKIVKLMNENPNMVVELGSHTDCRGTAAANEKLSTKRAEASAEYIKKKITNPARISGKGYGESKLKNGCACEGAVKSTCTEAEHQENRRTEFIIIKL